MSLGALGDAKRFADVNIDLKKLIGKLCFILAMGGTVYFVVADDATDAVTATTEAHDRRMAPVTRSPDHVERMLSNEAETIALAALPLTAETLRDVKAYSWCHLIEYRIVHQQDCEKVVL